MYITVSGKGKARIVQLRDDKRIPGTNKRKAVIVKNYGNYEQLLAENPAIIAELKAEARRLTLEKQAEAAPLSIDLPTGDVNSPADVAPSFHFGHALLHQLGKRMKLDVFFRQYAGRRDADELLHAIEYLLVRRCSDPESIYRCYREQPRYAGLNALTLDMLYSVLDVLAESKEDLIAFLAVFFDKNTKRQNANAYYDVTTYSFESTKWGELRMFGFSKNHKNNEVQVVMGLLIDNNGIPVTYELFPGNTMDQNTLQAAVERLKQLYQLEKITVVADRGLNSKDNLGYLCTAGHDFVVSYTLKKSSDAFKALALDLAGWTVTASDKETGEVLRMEKVVEETLAYQTLIDPKAPQPAAPRKRGRPKKYETHTVPVNIHLTWSAERAYDLYRRWVDRRPLHEIG